MPQTKTSVYFQTGNVSRDAPQVALVGPTSWAIVGPYFRQSGLHQFAPLPPLPAGTPMLDTSAMNQEHCQALTQRHITSPAGVADLAVFLSVMQANGACLAYATP